MLIPLPSSIPFRVKKMPKYNQILDRKSETAVLVVRISTTRGTFLASTYLDFCCVAHHTALIYTFSIKIVNSISNCLDGITISTPSGSVYDAILFQGMTSEWWCWKSKQKCLLWNWLMWWRLYIKKCEGIFNRPPPSIAIRCWLKFRHRAFNLFEGNVMLRMIFTTQQDPQEKQSRCKIVISKLSNFQASQSFVGLITWLAKLLQKQQFFAP